MSEAGKVGGERPIEWEGARPKFKRGKIRKAEKNSEKKGKKKKYIGLFRA